jgi:hypothetical protein
MERYLEVIAKSLLPLDAKPQRTQKRRLANIVKTRHERNVRIEVDDTPFAVALESLKF